MKQPPPSPRPAFWMSFLVAAVLALMPFHAFLTAWAASNTGFFDLWRIWKELLMITILLPLAIWQAWHSPNLRKWLLGSWLPRLIGLYFLLHIVMAGWSYSSGQVNAEALLYGLGVNLRFLLFFLIAIVAASLSPLLGRYWQRLLLLPAAAVAVFGLLQKFALPHDFLRHFGYGAKTIPAFQTIDNDITNIRVNSFLRGSNPLGTYLVLVIPAAMVTLRKKPVLLWISTAVLATVLLFTYSRSAWLGVAAASALMAYVLSGKPLPRLAVVVAAAFLIAGAGAYYLRNNDTVQTLLFHSTEHSTSAQSSNSVRLESLKNGVGDIFDQPLGRGPGTAGPASFRNTLPPRIAEDYYLQIGQEVGVAGLGIFIAIVGLVGRDLWRRRRETIGLVLLASLLGISLVNLVSHAWVDDTIAYLWWGLAGIALALPLPKQKS